MAFLSCSNKCAEVRASSLMSVSFMSFSLNNLFISAIAYSLITTTQEIKLLSAH